MVEVLESPSLFLQGMAGSRLPIAVAHGEGYANFHHRGDASKAIAAMRFTDNTGAASYNQQLSERRANAVAGVLISSGVSGGRIRTFGAGEDQPIASNLTPEGRAQNRRVEIVIVPNG